MGENHKINIMPNTSLWMKLGRTKYTIPKALSELIDNSIDNMVGNKVKVDINFAIDGNSIGILDDAKGMDMDTLARALTIADHIDNGNTIGEHGFGLEASSSYLGKDLLIYTKTEEMDKHLKFYYNQEEFLSKNEWTVDCEYIDAEELIEETGINFNRGTYILISDLNVRLYNGLVSTKQDNVEGTMVTKFQSIYKKFIERDMLELALHVERKRGAVDHIKIESPAKQNLAFKVNFDFVARNNGKDLKIKGWAGVLDFYDENIKNKKKYTSGFDIISKHKVILQHIHLGYSYHPEKRLVLGEIELENFQTTSDKTDFIRNSDWQALELILNQYITKPTLHIASTSYLNNLCDKVANDEDFDLNVDFSRTLNRGALTDEALDEFNTDLAPAELISRVINIEEDVFEESKDEIIDYMKDKRAEEIRRLEESAENQENSIEEVLGNADMGYDDEITLESVSNNQNSFVVDDSENIDFNITFKYQNVIINHKLKKINSKRPYIFEWKPEKGVININSNENMFIPGLYANLESFCTLNVINAIGDSSIVSTSEKTVLNEETVLNIRAGAINGFNGNFNIFRPIL